MLSRVDSFRAQSRFAKITSLPVLSKRCAPVGTISLHKKRLHFHALARSWESHIVAWSLTRIRTGKCSTIQLCRPLPLRFTSSTEVYRLEENQSSQNFHSMHFHHPARTTILAWYYPTLELKNSSPQLFRNYGCSPVKLPSEQISKQCFPSYTLSSSLFWSNGSLLP